MKFFQLICLMCILSGHSACARMAGGGGELDITERTNEVAQSNLDLGVAYLRQGEYEKSLDKLNKALEADPRYTPTLNVLGLLHQQLGKQEEAERYFKRALGIRGNDPNTLNNYGQFLCANERFDEAEQSFLKAAANPLYETPEVALTNAGTCALKDNRPDLGEKYFRQALDKNPRVAVALIQMAQLSYDQGNYLSARGYLQRYLEVARHTPSTLWLGIRIEQQLGDKDTLSSYALLLKNNYPDSQEAELLRQAGIK